MKFEIDYDSSRQVDLLTYFIFYNIIYQFKKTVKKR